MTGMGPCRACGKSFGKSGWFQPQWKAQLVTVKHQGDTYDRCKDCYNNRGDSHPAASTMPSSSSTDPWGLMNGAPCPVCSRSFSKSGWFKPQWDAQKAIVQHQSGTYDRCKECYHNVHALREPVVTGHVQRQATFQALCSDLRRHAATASKLEPFVELWYHSTPEKYRRDLACFGAVMCSKETDPKQVKVKKSLHHRLYSTDGDPSEFWTHDVTNAVYERAFHAAFPRLITNETANTVGNVIESILGLWHMAVQTGHYLQEDKAVFCVCFILDEWVAAVFHADEVMQQMQFYAGDVPVKTWLALVGAHGPASSSCSRPANNI